MVFQTNAAKTFVCCRLGEWHKKLYDAFTDEEKLVSINFFGFLSEIYSKINVVSSWEGTVSAVVGV